MTTTKTDREMNDAAMALMNIADRLNSGRGIHRDQIDFIKSLTVEEIEAISPDSEMILKWKDA